MKPIPSDVADVVKSYLALADERLPGKITGFYLVGSIVLDDYTPGQSDLDFVSVTDALLTPREMCALSGVHKLLTKRGLRPELDGIYVTTDQLLSEPNSQATPCCRSGRFLPRNGFAANPVTWQVLARYPCALRGPTKPEVRCSETRLRMWCIENLREYWSRWVRRAHTNPLRILYSLSPQAVAWGVLGVTRLHATVTTAGIVSKARAADYARKSLDPRWSTVVSEALSIRMGRAGSLYPNVFARRRDALSFMRFVISDAIAVEPALRTVWARRNDPGEERGKEGHRACLVTREKRNTSPIVTNPKPVGVTPSQPQASSHKP